MKVWYRAVCDKHKKMCVAMVSNPGCTKDYLGDKDVEIQTWLTNHYGCDLRLIHRDDQVDLLWDDYVEIN